MISSKDKIFTIEALKNQVEEWKKEGLKLVFTNGCFDIVHIGHVDYLEKAKKAGDKLIIGLNSDASVSRNKGKSRPVISQESRSRVLASMMFVDAVVLFDEDTPYDLISALKPDVLVKGNDWNISNIVGADIVIDNGGKVTTIELVPGFSTTSIVEKIQKIN